MSLTIPIHITDFERPQSFHLVESPQTISIVKEPLRVGPYSNIFQIKSITPSGIVIPTGLEMLKRPLWNPIFYELVIHYAGKQAAQLVFMHPLGIALVHSQENVAPLDFQVVNLG